jgi:hypothetical protein
MVGIVPAWFEVEMSQKAGGTRSLNQAASPRQCIFGSAHTRHFTSLECAPVNNCGRHLWPIGPVTGADPGRDGRRRRDHGDPAGANALDARQQLGTSIAGCG